MDDSVDLSDFASTDTEQTTTTSIDDIPPLTSASFTEFWFDQIEQRNREENHPERNDPSHNWPIGRFEPHQLGNCQRKWFYRWLNAPSEEHDPHGIFAIGHYIEEDVIEPWLRHVLEPTFTVDNAVHVSYDIDTRPIDAFNHDEQDTSLVDDIPFNQPNDSQPVHDTDTVTLTVAGSTDPLILDSDTGEAIALTEVKSTGSLDRVSSPKRMHLFQVHAYLQALDIEHAFIIYVDRNKLLHPKIFDIEFDPDTWDTVTTWVNETIEYAVNGELPPADPPEGWMCNYCEFRNRCGEGRSNLASDMGPHGFAPGYNDYPKHKIENHLNAHDDVKLTPSLALAYPDLAAEYGVERWKCPECTAEFEYTDETFADFENGQFNTPKCPSCKSVFDNDTHLVTESTFDQ